MNGSEFFFISNFTLVRADGEAYLQSHSRIKWRRTRSCTYKWNVLWKLFYAGARIIMIILYFLNKQFEYTWWDLMGGRTQSNTRQGRNIYELWWKSEGNVLFLQSSLGAVVALFWAFGRKISSCYDNEQKY